MKEYRILSATEFSELLSDVGHYNSDGSEDRKLLASYTSLLIKLHTLTEALRVASTHGLNLDAWPELRAFLE